MFYTVIESGDRKPAFSEDNKGTRAASTAAAQCCHAQQSRQAGSRTQRSWWRSASGCIGSGALLVLLPKCPMCIAAYLALWTGVSVAMPVATRLRSVVEIVFLALAVLLLARVAMRTRDQSFINKDAGTKRPARHREC